MVLSVVWVGSVLVVRWRLFSQKVLRAFARTFASPPVVMLVATGAFLIAFSSFRVDDAGLSGMSVATLPTSPVFIVAHADDATHRIEPVVGAPKAIRSSTESSVTQSADPARSSSRSHVIYDKGASDKAAPGPMAVAAILAPASSVTHVAQHIRKDHGVPGGVMSSLSAVITQRLQARREARAANAQAETLQSGETADAVEVIDARPQSLDQAVEQAAAIGRSAEETVEAKSETEAFDEPDASAAVQSTASLFVGPMTVDAIQPVFSNSEKFADSDQGEALAIHIEPDSATNSAEQDEPLMGPILPDHWVPDPLEPTADPSHRDPGDVPNSHPANPNDPMPTPDRPAPAVEPHVRVVFAAATSGTADSYDATVEDSHDEFVAVEEYLHTHAEDGDQDAPQDAPIASPTSEPAADEILTADASQADALVELDGERVAADGQLPLSRVSSRDDLADLLASESNHHTVRYLHEVSHRVRSGETMSRVLGSVGLSNDEVDSWIRAARDHYDPNRIYAGQDLALVLDMPERRLRRLKLEIDKDEVLVVENTTEGVVSRREEIAYEEGLRVVGGTIDQSLYVAAVAKGIPDRIISDIAEVLGWELNFGKDLHAGAKYRAIYQERTRLDTLESYPGKLLAVEIVNRGRTYEGFYFDAGDDRPAFYDRDGQPLGRQFLRYPVAYSRISSQFSHARYHPVLKRNIPHYGVDFAAPTGTPVRAVADGKVIKSGWHGGNGRFVKIVHDSVYQSGYAHLSRIASKVRVGSRVKKGQVIGYVGSSGLATGPHLHFAMYRKGKYIDPLRADLPRGRSLSGELLEAFNSNVNEAFQRYAEEGEEFERPTQMAALPVADSE